MAVPVAALKIVLNCDSLPADIGDEEHIPSVNDSMGMDDAFRQTGLKLSHFGLLLLIAYSLPAT